ncbi:hypothetical protein SAMN03080615_01651 [Amphritea atlantica]|uniref:Uncharacterized protein n=1 Tax=Amphritea atlantica TaxID=355243 RepID=A0A1H9GFD6_9GAMM|nr:hypothetical protein [Amphritea atlantica]SEQ48822.1 hypothetical protein SAMN03080615_01651 [Amphritea atlantica]
MQLIYFIVGGVCFYVLWQCGHVWLVLDAANPHRRLTHFAQHQVVLIALSALFCIGLCVVTVLSQECGYGALGRWWAMFDVFVCIIMLAQLKNLKLSLSVGRHG